MTARMVRTDSQSSPELPRPRDLSRFRWDSPALIWALRGFTVLVIAIVVSTGHTRIDRANVAAPAYAIAGGHPRNAYPPASVPDRQSTLFQPPGFAVFAAVPMALWDGIVGPGGASAALTFAGFSAVFLVVLGAGRL